MKKIRNLFACLSAIAVIATCSLTVSANDVVESEAYNEWVISNNYQRYPDYKERLSKLPDYYDDMLYIKDIESFVEVTLLIKEMTRENSIAVYNAYTHYDQLVTLKNTNYTNPTADEINVFLKENNLKAQIKEYNNQNLSSDSYSLEIKLAYEKDVTWDDVNAVTTALATEFNLHLFNFFFASGETVVFESETSVMTIAGDLDLNNEQGIADIVALTKYNTSPELYPITDATALANADINQDGTIDAIDTSLLIEIMLGTFESAV